MAKQEWTEEDVQSVICNPVYTGMGPYPQIIDDEQWVQANAKLIEEIGMEAYLHQLLKTLRKTLGG